MRTPEAIETHIAEAFRHHPPKGDQIERYVRIRDAGAAFARELAACCPPSADLTDAIRKVREAVMTANASIAIAEAE